MYLHVKEHNMLYIKAPAIAYTPSIIRKRSFIYASQLLLFLLQLGVFNAFLIWLDSWCSRAPQHVHESYGSNSTMLDRELYHSTSKPIGDEEDTLKYFTTFDIMPHKPIFRVVVRSQIVVPPTILLSQ